MVYGNHPGSARATRTLPFAEEPWKPRVCVYEQASVGRLEEWTFSEDCINLYKQQEALWFLGVLGCRGPHLQVVKQLPVICSSDYPVHHSLSNCGLSAVVIHHAAGLHIQVGLKGLFDVCWICPIGPGGSGREPEPGHLTNPTDPVFGVFRVHESMSFSRKSPRDRWPFGYTLVKCLTCQL